MVIKHMNKLAIGVFLSMITSFSMAGVVPVDLYRGGNSTSARMDNVRVTDVQIFHQGNRDWVVGGEGGISTFSTPPSNTKNWWVIRAGTEYDDNHFKLINDRGNHWSWAPADTMRLQHYKNYLSSLNNKFTKLK